MKTYNHGIQLSRTLRRWCLRKIAPNYVVNVWEVVVGVGGRVGLVQINRMERFVHYRFATEDNSSPS
jgi:hypothetical protein